MIEFTWETLDKTEEVAREAARCSMAYHYFFGTLTGYESYPEQVLQFRQDFELSSPALFGSFVELSGYEEVIQDLVGLKEYKNNLRVFSKDREIKEKIEQEVETIKERLRFRFYDLNVLVQNLIMAVYPFYLINEREVPFVSTEEVQRARKELDELDSNPILAGFGKERLSAAGNWFHGLLSACTNFTETVKNTKIVFFAMETVAGKMIIPSLLDLSPAEKEEFFLELESEITKERA